MPQSQCTYKGCGKDYGYNNYDDNEVSPDIQQNDSPLQSEILSESDLEYDPGEAVKVELEPPTENGHHNEGEHQASVPLIDTSTFGPADVDRYDEYTGVSLAEVLRDKQSVKDYYYLYVGVPKNSVNDFKNTLLKAGVQSNK